MSHQDRRDPLPVDYQYPTHGVDCDCPPCRARFIEVACDVWSEHIQVNVTRTYLDQFVPPTQTAYGWGV